MCVPAAPKGGLFPLSATKPPAAARVSVIANTFQIYRTFPIENLVIASNVLGIRELLSV